jgi:hypothetical protein
MDTTSEDSVMKCIRLTLTEVGKHLVFRKKSMILTLRQLSFMHQLGPLFLILYLNLELLFPSKNKNLSLSP